MFSFIRSLILHSFLTWRHYFERRNLDPIRSIKHQITNHQIINLWSSKYQVILIFFICRNFSKILKGLQQWPLKYFYNFFCQPPSVWSSWWFFCLCKETSPYCRPTELSSSRQLHPLSTHSHLNRLVMTENIPISHAAMKLLPLFSLCYINAHPHYKKKSLKFFSSENSIYGKCY